MASNRLDYTKEVLKMKKAFFPVSILLILFIVSTCYVPTYDEPFQNEVTYQNENASGRTCSGPANTDSITILPPGPVTLPADQSRLFNATMYNSDGIPLGGIPEWSVSEGSIAPQGGSEAIYYPNLVGTHTVWACAGDITASVEVMVTLGATQSIDLSGNKVNLSADEVLQLTVTEYDIRGNSGTMFVPSSDWTIPDGSSIHVQPGQAAIWTPGPIGMQTISVTTGGFTSSWEVNVSRGMGVDLVLSADRTILTSDETVDLTMAIADIRGNLIEVDGNWSTLAPQANAWITGNGSQATFDGNLVGNWTIRAEYNGPESGNVNMSDELVMDVRVGRISLISIDGHNSNLETGDVLQLNPIATDLDGNIISDATFNWSVEGGSGIESIDVENNTFTPSTEGQHNIQVESGGRPSSIRIQVGWSEPIDLNVTTTDGDWYLTVITGESLPLHVEGLDVMGEWHPYNPSWQVDENFGTIEVSGGDGDYIYHAEGVNWTQLHAFANGKEYTILVYVTPGPLDHLEVDISDSGVQGESVLFTVRGYDVSGNGVAIPICDLTMTSSAGRTECTQELGWRLYLDNDGEQHIITATYDEAQGTGFIDIQATLLDGKFGSSRDVMAGGAVLIALLISIVLIVVHSRVKKLANEYEEEVAEEEKERAIEELGVPLPPQVSPKGMSRMGPPSPPPPAFMFGTGIAPNSSSAAPTLGVFVRSDQPYIPGQSVPQPVPQADWNSPASTGTAQIPPEVNNWDDPGVSGAANGVTAIPNPAPQESTTTQAPLTTNDALNALGVSNEESLDEGKKETNALGNALSMFSSPDEESDEKAGDEEEIDSSSEEAASTEIVDEDGEVESSDENVDENLEGESTDEIVDENAEQESTSEVESSETEESPSDVEPSESPDSADDGEESQSDLATSETEESESEVTPTETEESPSDLATSETEESESEVTPTETEESDDASPDTAEEIGDENLEGESTKEIVDKNVEQKSSSKANSTEQSDWDDIGQEDWNDTPKESTQEVEWGSWDDEVEKELESKDIVPGLGPQTDGKILKPLPGTKKGESGWYFDGEGKPSLWSFEPIGWEKKD